MAECNKNGMNVSVIQNDCVAGMSVLQEKIASAIITSPPYNIGIKYNKHKDNLPNDAYLSWLGKVFSSCNRVLRDDGQFFLQMGGTSVDPLIPWRVLSVARTSGFVLQNEIIWVKNITVGGQSFGQFKPINSRRYLNHTHEFIFHLTKQGNVPVNRLAVGVPFTYPSNIKRFHKTGAKPDKRCKGNVWFIPYETIQAKSDKGEHPATFPVALPEMCIRLAGIPKKSLVIDPFAGTGTTLVACQKLGMSGLGFEISAKYCKFANQRLEELA